MFHNLVLRIILFCLLPGWAWAAICTGNAGGTNNWGPIGTVTSDCGVPTGADTFVFPSGEDVVAVDDIAFTADAAGFTLQNGSTFTASAVDQGQSLTFVFFRGQDTYPGGGVTDVGAFFEPGVVMDLQGGWAQWGPASPSLQEEVSEALETIWAVDGIAPCGDGTDDVAGEVGGAGDCATGDEENTWCFIWTKDRNDPEDGNGNGGENHLAEAVGEVQQYWIVQPLYPSIDYGHAYVVPIAPDAVGDSYEVCVDPRQVHPAYVQASADRPLANRSTTLVTTAQDVKVGDTCVDLAAGTLAADGDKLGQCFRLVGEAQGRANKIAKSLDGVTCAGGAGNDSVYFSDLTPMRDAKAAGAGAATISTICIQQGDNVGVLAPIWLVNGDTTYADDQAKLLVESTNVTMKGVATYNLGLVDFDGAVLNPESDSVHVMGGGKVLFENMNNVELSCWSKVGGDVAGGNVAFEFADIGDHTYVRDTKVRYSGDWAFTTSGSAMGPAEFERTSCEMISHLTASNEGCILNNNDWSHVKTKHVGCFDCVGGSNGATANIFSSSTNRLTSYGTVVYGTLKGGLTGLGGGNGVYAYDVLARGIVTNRTSLNWFGLYTDGVDLKDFAGPGMLVPLEPFIGGLSTTFKGAILQDGTTGNDEVLGIAEGPSTGDTLSWIILWNWLTTNVAGTSDVIRVTQDDSAATVSTLTDVTVGWDPEVTSDWDTVIAVVGDTGNETRFNFGDIAIVGHAGSDNNTDYISVDLDANIIDEVVGGNVCVSSGSVASGGAGSYTAVDDIGTYAVEPILGRYPLTERVNRVMALRTLYDNWECGVARGAAGMGINPNGHCWMYEQIGAKCPNRPNLSGGAF